MKEPVPVRREVPLAQAKPGGARHAEGRRSTAERSATVSVRCYARMKPQRVYPLVVEVPPASAARPAANMSHTPVVVRPIIPGAVVTPPDQRLDLSHPNDSVTFQVTPMARGWLKGARVEVVHQGHLLQTIPLKMKAASQRLTWILLVLAILVPVFLVKYTRYDRPTGELPVRMKKPDLGPEAAAKMEEGKKKIEEAKKKGKKGVGKKAPGNGKEEPDNGKQPGAGENEKSEEIPAPKEAGEGDEVQPILFLDQDDQPQPQPKEQPKGPFMPKDMMGKMGKGGMQMPKDMMGKMGKGGMQMPPNGGMPAEPPPILPSIEPKTEPMPAEPWELFENSMRKIVHENTPEVPYVTDWIANKNYDSKFYRSKDEATHEDNMDDLASVLAFGYKWFHLLCTDANLPFYLSIGLFGLAVISWARRRPYRRRVRRPVTLPAAGEGTAGETLPLGPRDEPPTLQPVD